MNIVDQRILIPAPSDVVWAYVSDITKNPAWQTDCRGITFLTSRRGGPGTRWRQEMEKGREQVIEITAWYDRLGYQYTYIDGDPFRNTTGRMRLQEIAEGTVVQWTLTYEGGGMLGSVRGSFGAKRQAENAMIASLKTLHKQVTTSVRDQKAQLREAKSLMREAPDVEARAQYQPRHQPAVNLRGEGDEAILFKPISSDEPIVKHPIPEPPVVDDDTRPRPAVAPPPTPRATIDELVEQSEEPEFLDDLSRFAPPPDYYKSDTEPVKTIRPEDLAPSAPATPPALSTDELERAVSDLMDQPAKTDVPARADAIPDNPFASVGFDTFIGAKPVPPQEVRPEETSPPVSPAPPSLTTDELNRAVADLLDEPIKAADATGDLSFDDLLVEPRKDPTPAALDDDSDLAFDDLLAEPAAPAPSEIDHEVPVTPPHAAVEPELSAPPPDAAAAETATTTPRVDEPLADALDTATMSIWEVFGVPKPSETAEVPAVDTSPEPSVDTPDTAAESAVDLAAEPTTELTTDSDGDTVPGPQASYDPDATMVGFRPVAPADETTSDQEAPQTAEAVTDAATETTAVPADEAADEARAAPAEPVAEVAGSESVETIEPVVDAIEPAVEAESNAEPMAEPQVEKATDLAADSMTEPAIEPVAEPAGADLQQVTATGPVESGPLAASGNVSLPSGRTGLRAHVRRQSTRVRRPT